MRRFSIKEDSNSNTKMRILLFALALALTATACGPSKTAEQVAEEACTCIKSSADAMMADVDKFAAADTSTFKSEMLNEANAKFEAVMTKLSECGAQTAEKEENVKVLVDQKAKAVFDEKTAECTKGYTERVEKAKQKLSDLSTQLAAKADSTVKDAKDKVKDALAKVPVHTNKKK